MKRCDADPLLRKRADGAKHVTGQAKQKQKGWPESSWGGVLKLAAFGWRSEGGVTHELVKGSVLWVGEFSLGKALVLEWQKHRYGWRRGLHRPLDGLQWEASGSQVREQLVTRMKLSSKCMILQVSSGGNFYLSCSFIDCVREKDNEQGSIGNMG